MHLFDPPLNTITLIFLICFRSNSPYLASALAIQDKIDSFTPVVHCTSHMCPIRVHWHIKQNYKEYWRVKITITNFNYRMNYTEWNLVAQHPNFNNLTETFSFNYKPIIPYASISKYLNLVRNFDHFPIFYFEMICPFLFSR